MNENIINIEELSKKYIISHQYNTNRSHSYNTLRDVIASGAKRGLNRLSYFFHIPHQPPPKDHLTKKEEFWALKNISFEIKQGEKIGIIGRNGAGKTTLLKLLSRITEPTSGRMHINGRVASLLEVGTGFHPELTGRENIYLNGAILGMSRAEITRKFDEIVDFAEIEKFLDTPAKRYSSGMYVRLAFSVAAHLEPEILLVDEVLAVGDFAFQKKCLGKMQNVAEEGRTILFVSHQMEAITKLCSRVILLEGGSIIDEGIPDKVVKRYLDSNQQLTYRSLKDRKDRIGDGRIRFTDTWIEDKYNRRTKFVQSGDSLTIVAEYQVLDSKNVSNIVVAFALNGRDGIQITDLSNLTTGDFFHGTIPRKGLFRCFIPRFPMNSGIYTYNAIVRSGMAIEDYVMNAGCFEVESGDYFGTGKVVEKQFLLFIENKWELMSS